MTSTISMNISGNWPEAEQLNILYPAHARYRYCADTPIQFTPPDGLGEPGVRHDIIVCDTRVQHDVGSGNDYIVITRKRDAISIRREWHHADVNSAARLLVDAHNDCRQLKNADRPDVTKLVFGGFGHGVRQGELQQTRVLQVSVLRQNIFSDHAVEVPEQIKRRRRENRFPNTEVHESRKYRERLTCETDHVALVPLSRRSLRA